MQRTVSMARSIICDLKGSYLKWELIATLMKCA